VEVEAVSVSNETWHPLNGRMAFLLPIAEMAYARRLEHRMSHSGKYLVQTGCFGVWNKCLLAGVTSGEALTLLSNSCRRFSRCANAGVPDFPENHATCLRTSSCLDSYETGAPARAALKWRAKCNVLGSLARNFAGRVNSQNQQVDLMSTKATSLFLPSVPAFPLGVDARWETQNRTVWNEQEHASEERELVYEISWIAELGVWRRFLRSQQKARN